MMDDDVGGNSDGVCWYVSLSSDDGVGDGSSHWLVVWTEAHRIVDWYDASC